MTDAELVGADRSLLRSSAVMTVGTFLSRLTGYLRSVLLVAAIGLALHADLFTVANTVPNALYILVAGGVLNAVLVPQLVRAMRHDADGGAAYANRVLTLVGLVLLVTTVLAVVFAPALMRLYAPGELYEPEFAAQRESFETFARLCLPQIFFYGMTVLAGQVLNARGRFGPMMFAPIANNVLACGVLGVYLLVYEPTSGSAAYSTGEEWLLGLGSTVGVAAQAVVLVPYLRASGLRFRPRFDFRGTGLRHTGRLAVWTVLFVVVSQLGYLVVTRLAVEGAAAAALAGEAAAVGATVYQNGFLLVMLPHALVTVSLATALLPRLSRQVAAGRLAEMRRDLVATTRLAAAGTIFAGLVLLAIAFPLTRLLFGWGAGAGETRALAVTLMLFVPGLVAFTIHYIALRGFYALEDTRTPFLVQCVVVGVNVTSALLLSALAGRPSAMVLAGSFSIANAVGAVVSTAALARRLDGLHRVELAWFLLRASAAAAPAALLAFGGALLGQVLGDNLSGADSSRLGALLAVLLGGALAVPTYLAGARLLRLREVSRVTDLVSSRLRRGRRGSRLGAQASHAPSPESPSIGRDPGVDTDIATDTDTDSSGNDPTAVDGRVVGSAGSRATTNDTTITDSTATDMGETIIGVPPPDPGAVGGDARGAAEGGGHGGTRAAAAPDVDRTTGRRSVSAPAVAAGDLIADRYRLEDLLATAGGAATWRGVDEVLSRPVALHLIDLDDPRADDLARAARSAASVADPHFLRMLDISDDGRHVYVVREWVLGRNLAEALTGGVFDPDDATYVAHELAAAMASAHRAGLSHLRLEPDTVLLAESGQVKVVDVEVDRVLRGSTSGDAARTDAEGIGRILYVLLTGRWPDGPLMGIPSAPTQDDRLCSPRQVLAGVPGPLDEVCDRILGDPPRAHQEPLHTPAQVEEALDYVAGRPARRRSLTLPPPPATHTTDSSNATPTQTWRRPDQPPAPLPGPPRRRRGGAVLGGIVAVVLLAGALLLGYQLADRLFGDDPAPPEPSAPTAAPEIDPVELEIAEAVAYDPPELGGSGDENDGLAPSAIDDDPDTAWTTVNYFDPLELQKDGVGLVLDLGEVQTVTGVELALLTGGGTLELRAAAEDAIELPPTVDDFAVIGEPLAEPEATAAVTFAEPVNTRFLLVWFTVLPQLDSNYRNGVADAVVLGE